jgi:hypothetical protein
MSKNTAILFDHLDAMNEALKLVKNRFDGFKIYQNGEFLGVNSLNAIPEIDFRIVLELPSGKAVYFVSLLDEMSEDDILNNDMNVPNKRLMFKHERLLANSGSLFAEGIKKSGGMPESIYSFFGAMYYFKGFLVAGSELPDDEKSLKLTELKPIFR